MSASCAQVALRASNLDRQLRALPHCTARRSATRCAPTPRRVQRQAVAWKLDAVRGRFSASCSRTYACWAVRIPELIARSGTPVTIRSSMHTFTTCGHPSCRRCVHASAPSTAPACFGWLAFGNELPATCGWPAASDDSATCPRPSCRPSSTARSTRLRQADGGVNGVPR